MLKARFSAPDIKGVWCMLRKTQDAVQKCQTETGTGCMMKQYVTIRDENKLAKEELLNVTYVTVLHVHTYIVHICAGNYMKINDKKT